MKLTKLHIFLILILSLMFAGVLGHTYYEGMETNDSITIFLPNNEKVKGIKKNKVPEGKEDLYMKLKVIPYNDTPKDLYKHIKPGEYVYFLINIETVLTSKQNLNEDEKYVYILKSENVKDKIKNSKNHKQLSNEDLYILKSKIVVPTCPIGLTYGPVKNDSYPEQENQRDTIKQPTKDTDKTQNNKEINKQAQTNQSNQLPQSNQDNQPKPLNVSNIPYPVSQDLDGPLPNDATSRYYSYASFSPLKQDDERLPVPVLADFSTFGM